MFASGTVKTVAAAMVSVQILLEVDRVQEFIRSLTNVKVPKPILENWLVVGGAYSATGDASVALVSLLVLQLVHALKEGTGPAE